MQKRFIYVCFVALALLCGIVWFQTNQSEPTIDHAPAPEQSEAPPSIPSESQGNEPTASTMSAQLHASGTEPISDLVTLHKTLQYYRLDNAGRLPIGTNQEITRALTKEAPMRLPYIDSNHPAINEAGELTDRWQSPFFFHALSSERVEIRSAGPDTELFTQDDLLWPETPPPPPDSSGIERSVSIR